MRLGRIFPRRGNARIAQGKSTTADAALGMIRPDASRPVGPRRRSSFSTPPRRPAKMMRASLAAASTRTLSGGRRGFQPPHKSRHTVRPLGPEGCFSSAPTGATPLSASSSALTAAPSNQINAELHRPRKTLHTGSVLCQGMIRRGGPCRKANKRVTGLNPCEMLVEPRSYAEKTNGRPRQIPNFLGGGPSKLAWAGGY